MRQTKQACVRPSVCCIVLTLSRPPQTATEQLAATEETTAACREYFKLQVQRRKPVGSNAPLLRSCATLRTHPAREHIYTRNKTQRLLPGAVGHKGVKSMPVKPKVINYGFQSSQTNCRKRTGKKKNREEQNTFNQSRLRCAFCFLIVNLNTVSLARTRKWSYCKIPGRLLTGAANSLPSLMAALAFFFPLRPPVMRKQCSG